MVSVDFPSTTFTDVVVEFFSGRHDKQIVFHSIESVLKSLRQPPSFRNTIRLEIIESAIRTMDEKADLIKSIRIENPFVNCHIADRHIMASSRTQIGHSWYFPDTPSQSTADRHIVTSTDDPRITHSRSFPDNTVESCSESGDGCYTPDSESSSPVEEHNNNNNEQPLAKRAPSHPNVLSENCGEGFICLSVMIGVVGALFDIVSHLRANPNFLDFEPWYQVLDACLTYIWIQACCFGFPVHMLCSLWDMYRRERR